jgi:hypothetical protein
VTLAQVGMLVSFALLCAWHAWQSREMLLTDTPPHALWYLAGESAAVAMTFGARWLGADNIQALVIAPGSYQLLVGALLPVDKRLNRPLGLGRAASTAGSLLLLLPTLAQSFTAADGWIYALLLATEALIIVGVGLGTRARVLILTGSAFVVLAAIRGAVVAYQNGVPAALVIAALAVLLMGGATWLSLRARGAENAG